MRTESAATLIAMLRDNGYPKMAALLIQSERWRLWRMGLIAGLDRPWLPKWASDALGRRWERLNGRK